MMRHVRHYFTPRFRWRLVVRSTLPVHVAGLPIVILILAAIGSVSARNADDPPPDQSGSKQAETAQSAEKDLADKRLAFMKMALARFAIQVEDRKEPAKLVDTCLRWTNPIGTASDGIIAVYAFKEGRPVALGKFFTNGKKRWVNEFAILSEGDVKLMRSDREFWKPSEFVSKFTDLPNSPVPAAKPALRMTQMRAVAADFSVTNHFGSPEVQHDMRLLPQPAHRYSEEGKILDGALFVFVLGTDAECCLLVEAYRDDKGSRYRYALAPLTIYKLEARYKDKPVWDIERRMLFGKNCLCYFANGYTPEPGEVLPE